MVNKYDCVRYRLKVDSRGDKGKLIRERLSIPLWDRIEGTLWASFFGEYDVLTRSVMLGMRKEDEG